MSAQGVVSGEPEGDQKGAGGHLFGPGGVVALCLSRKSWGVDSKNLPPGQSFRGG